MLNFLTSALGLGSAALSYVGAQQQNRMAKQAAQDQMDFQERMSNTSYQRAMKDMSAAGLNPMLAYNQGGASTPSGSSYDPQNAIEGSISSARANMQAKAELDNVRSQTALNNALRKSAAEDAILKSNSAAVAKANEDILKEDLKGAKVRNKVEEDFGYSTGVAKKFLQFLPIPNFKSFRRN